MTARNSARTLLWAAIAGGAVGLFVWACYALGAVL